MKLKIDKNTKYTDIAHYISLMTEEDINLLLKKINFDFGTLKISYFCEILEKQDKMIDAIKLRAFERNNAFDFFTWIYGFPLFIEYFSNELKKFEAPVTEAVKIASGTLPKTSITESIMIFLQDFFKRTSFAEVEDLTVNDYFLAKKAAGLREIFEYNLNQYHNRKIKK